MPLLVRALIVAILAAIVLHAATHRYRVHSNPSIAISGITQDKDGVLWLAAADGLYQFDGLHFRKITAFPFSSARLLAVTTDGTLWIACADGLVRYNGGKFEVRHRLEFTGLAAIGSRVYASSQHLWEFGPNGVGIRHAVFNPRRDLFADSAGALWFTCETGMAACRAETYPSLPESPQFFALPETNDQAIVDIRGRLWAASPNKAVANVGNQPALELRRRASRTLWRPSPLVLGHDGQIWFLGETVRGLLAEITYSRQSHGVPTAGFQDRRGHLWVALQGEGLIEWIEEPRWERWSSHEFGGQAVTQIAKDQRGNVFAVADGSLRRLDREKDRWIVVKEGKDRYAAVFLPAPGELLIATVEDGLRRITTEGAELEHVSGSRLARPTAIAVVPDWIREIVGGRSGQIWLTSRKGLFRLEGAKGALRLTRETLPPGEVSLQVDVEVDSENRLWIAYRRGISWRDERGSWQKLVTEPPLAELQSFALGKNRDDDIWVSYKTPGKFSRVHWSGERWVVTDFLASQGYGPTTTHFINRDSRGWIWRGSSSGLHVSDGRNTAPEDWILLTESRGLASAVPRQYGFFEDTDGSVWIAGEEGVSHFYPDPSWFQAPRTEVKPRITRLELDGREIPLSELERGKLRGAVNLLRIEIGSLDAPAFHEYPFRYRVLPLFSDWRPSRDGVVELDHPASNSYRLEVAYSGNGTAPILSQEFQIGNTFSLLRLSWAPAIAILLAGILFAAYPTNWLERASYRISKLIYLKKVQNGQPLEDDEPVPLRHVGEVLADKYEIGQPVSKGGFSELYEARTLNGSRSRVAIKILKAPRTNQGWMRDRFAHEVAALRSIDHPGVIRVLDWWIGESGEPCLVMPFLEGPTMRHVLAAGPLPPQQVGRLILQIGSALTEVHARGIVHRDLKPENIMLAHSGRPDERAIIIDFGTAGLRGADGEMAVTTMLAGSLRYMAPEQLTGHYSTTADIYSLGAITLELLTGQGLFNLGSHYSSDSFVWELEGMLGRAVGMELAHPFASLLYPAFSPQPDRRPHRAAAWANDMAAILAQVEKKVDQPST